MSVSVTSQSGLRLLSAAVLLLLSCLSGIASATPTVPPAMPLSSTCQQATAMSLGQTNFGSFIDTDTSYYWSYTPATTQSYTITLTSPGGADFDLYLYGGCDVNGEGLNEIAASVLTTSVDAVTRSLTSGLTYYIRVLRYEGAGEYTIRVAVAVPTNTPTSTSTRTNTPTPTRTPTATPTPVITPGTGNDSCSTASLMDFSTLMYGSLGAASPLDWWTYSTGQNRNYVVRLSSAAGTDYTLEVFDTCQSGTPSQLLGDDFSSGTQKSVEFPSTSQNPVFFRVFQRSGSGTYSLIIDQSASTPVPTATPGTNNNDCTVAWQMLPSVTQYESIGSTGDLDWFFMDVSAAGRLYVDLTVPSDIDMALEVHDTCPSTAPLCTGNRVGLGVGESCQIDVPAAGRYYFLAQAANNSDVTGSNYALRVNFQQGGGPTFTPTPIAPTPTATATINDTCARALPIGTGTVAGSSFASIDPRWYLFDAPGPGTLTATVVGGFLGSFRVEIYSSCGGTELCGPASGGTIDDDCTLSVTARPYYIKVYSELTIFPDFDLTVGFVSTGPTATPTRTPTFTRTPTPTVTGTRTSTPSPTPTATGSPTGFATITPTLTPTTQGTNTHTPTPTPSHTPQATSTPSPTSTIGVENNQCSAATELSLNNDAADRLVSPDREAWFVVQLPGPGELSVDLDVPGTNDLDLALYLQCGGLPICTSAQAPGLDEVCVFDNDRPRQVLLKVYAPPSAAIPNRDFVLDLYWVPRLDTPTPTFTATPLVTPTSTGTPSPTPNPGDDTCLGANTLAYAQGWIDTIAPAGDVDWFQFTATYAAQLQISLEVPVAFNFDLELYRSCTDSQPLTSSRNGTGQNEACLLDVMPGTYHARVFSPDNSFNPLFPYQILISVLSTPSPTPTNTPTSTPTPTPQAAKNRVLVAGYMDTKISAATGGRVSMLALVSDGGGDPTDKLEMLYQGQPAGVELPGEYRAGMWTFSYTLDLPRTFPFTVLLELQPTDATGLKGGTWPYLEVR